MLDVNRILDPEIWDSRVKILELLNLESQICLFGKIWQLQQRHGVIKPPQADSNFGSWI